MATRKQDNANPGFSADNPSADAIRAQLLKGQSESAARSAITDSLELFSFLGTLPDAFAASQAREAKRLQKSGGENHPRLLALKASIERTDMLRSNARSGKARADRGIAAVSDPNDIFHGFVSDRDFRPLQGYTVKLLAAGATSGKNGLSAATDPDGYFSITLKTKTKKGDYSFAGREGANAAFVEAIQGLFGMTSPTRTPAAAASGAEASGAEASVAEHAASAATAKTATPKSGPSKIGTAKAEAARIGVEIRSPNGKRFVQDPITGLMDGGSMYREYFLEGETGRKTSGRYVGNPGKRELHDTEKVIRSCNFNSIKPEARVYFDDTATAEKAGYDYCAHCFGKAKSKR